MPWIRKLSPERMPITLMMTVGGIKWKCHKDRHIPGSEHLDPLLQSQVQPWAQCPRVMLSLRSLNWLSHQEWLHVSIRAKTFNVNGNVWGQGVCKPQGPPDTRVRIWWFFPGTWLTLSSPQRQTQAWPQGKCLLKHKGSTDSQWDTDSQETGFLQVT
jgi:hypothetical protein